MKNPIEHFLNSVTMYRIVLYGLGAMAIFAAILGFTGVLFYTGLQLIVSLFVLAAACLLVNYLFAWWYKAPTNLDSTLITALILFFILSPAGTPRDAAWLAIAGAIAMASKYVVAVNNKHLFNPAAFAAFVLGFTPGGGPIWWVGSIYLLPAALIVGLLVVKKIRHFPLFLSGVGASAIAVILLALRTDSSVTVLLEQHFVSWPIVFFASIMLTEPQTTPPTKRQQMMYGVLVGALSSWPFRIGPLYATPEFALLLGNLFSWIVSMKRRLSLKLREKVELAKDTYEFIFPYNKEFSFAPGQYLEWTLPHSGSDSRGIRRYFTIASSPTEDSLRLGVRFGPKASSYKQKLLALGAGDILFAGPLAGDFVLPKDPKQKLVFIAGGIGITPFRSMLRYLLDRGEERDIVLFYSNKTFEDVAYRDFLKQAEEKLGTKTVHLVSDESPAPAGWTVERGFLTREILQSHVPDWKERMFYLSGPNAMVEAYKKLLRGMGVRGSRIVTDYFPGYA